MKPAFSIEPTSATNDIFHLLIEVASHGISFTWFSKDPFTVKGLLVYNFTGTDQLADMKEVINHIAVFTRELVSTAICYDYKESLLIPAKFGYASAGEEILSLVYGENAGTVVKKDSLQSGDIYNLYRVQQSIQTLLAQEFPVAKVFHSSSLQADILTAKENHLYCIIFHNTIKLILFVEGKLQIIQQFSYQTPSDVVYHLLNVCQQHEVIPEEVNLQLSGMIDVESILYIEIYKYFLHINFEIIPGNVAVPREMQNLPAHFFSHLTDLASCVS